MRAGGTSLRAQHQLSFELPVHRALPGPWEAEGRRRAKGKPQWAEYPVSSPLQSWAAQHTWPLQEGPGPAGMAALTLVHGEGEELVPEHLVHEPIWPAERGH